MPMHEPFQTPQGRRELQRVQDQLERDGERFRAVVFVVLLGLMVGGCIAGLASVAFGHVIEHQLDMRDGLL